jgi:SAM-dependent methyltransferase
MPHIGGAVPTEAPSGWVLRWAPLVERGPVLDLACGGGRHARLFASRGLEVVAVDRESQVFAEKVEFVQADLEDGSPWPLAGRRFAAIVVTNYLHRPLFPRIAESLEEGGVLIYETFMIGNEKYGRPSNPQFLLRPGELLEAFATLTPVGFEQGRVERPKPAMIQRLCALRGPAERIELGIESAP